MRLADYLRTAFRGGIAYSDAAHLCLAIYCLANVIPAGTVEGELTMACIAEAFADLARHGLVKDYETGDSVLFGANYHAIEDKGHWVEVQASVLKLGMQYDVARVARLKSMMQEATPR